jgi:broad specificity phosphatase PhoE
MELYLIRHGQSTNNALGADITRRTRDAPLTDLGHQQARLVADYLANGTHKETVIMRGGENALLEDRHGFGISRLYCSAMHRALQTAHPISQALGLQPHVWVDIHETGGIYMDEADGKRVGYPGLTRAEINEQFGGYVLSEDVTDMGWWNRDYETTAVSQGRAIRVADQLWQWAAISPDERIGIVTHGAFMSQLLKALMNQLPGNRIFYNHYNTAITSVYLNEERSLSLRYLNVVAHLPFEMITA